MKVGIITNEDKDKNFEYTRQIIDFVISKNVIPILPLKFEPYFDHSSILFWKDEVLFKNSDFIIVLGGDGTMLHWGVKIAKYNKNILGINMGNLGYLTDVEKSDGILAIQKVLNNEYNVEKRMMIEVEINGKKQAALNEVTINNGSIAKMIKLGVDINGKCIDRFSADGIIISTPTGSTAYNLSAGGPILKPDTELMVITYVCPHAIFSRPYVISHTDEVMVYTTDRDTHAFLSLDGQNSISINFGDKVYIRKYSFYTNIIKTTGLNFYDILKKKMFEVRM